MRDLPVSSPLGRRRKELSLFAVWNAKYAFGDANADERSIDSFAIDGGVGIIMKMKIGNIGASPMKTWISRKAIVGCRLSTIESMPVRFGKTILNRPRTLEKVAANSKLNVLLGEKGLTERIVNLL